MARDRRALSVGVAVLALATGAVGAFTFGIERAPRWPSLASAPEPAASGHVAWTTLESAPGEPYSEQTCLWLEDLASGPAVQLECRGYAGGGGPVYSAVWSGSDSIVIRYGTRTLTVAAGKVLSSEQDTNPERPDGPAQPGFDSGDRLSQPGGPLSVSIEDDDHFRDQVVVHDGDASSVVLDAGPRDDYLFHRVQWSPDGRWLLVTDSRNRAVLVSAMGEPTPRVVATGAWDSQWVQPE
ncbi:MAG TPA: hypothetical protein VF855_08240 [Acidimicrobiales bacterium]